ncbi:MAG: TIGR02453 family protein, partial [Candidatus Dormibacteraeota bacterium]|nr:TIGR02453 family protein [Candidatus Dormibacteraeota bacterium]
MTDTVFRGWPEEFQRFFIGLELDNSKRYFEAHRDVYQTAV